jgi:hypothetical protein
MSNLFELLAIEEDELVPPKPEPRECPNNSVFNYYWGDITEEDPLPPLPKWSKTPNVSKK